MMPRYALNLPAALKQAAEAWAARQGVSLNQFILWAVAEKVGSLEASLDDPAFPYVTYRRGASGQPTPVIRGTGVRVQTVETARRVWGLSSEQIASEYGLSENSVRGALGFAAAHRGEIDAAIASETQIEPADGQAQAPPGR
jgi:uncharacterized protein (DUF433 family)